MEDKLLTKKNLLWDLARMQHATKHFIPSLTGFNLVLRYKDLEIKDSIRYLAIINALATPIATIHENLCQARNRINCGYL